MISLSFVFLFICFLFVCFFSHERAKADQFCGTLEFYYFYSSILKFAIIFKHMHVLC